ncbi:MAG: TetR/AcrR family transcriptional regulator [Thiohalomonadaceae bacterium]
MRVRKVGRAFRTEPRQARSLASVARILQAARTLLEQDGFQRLTTNHIAHEANVDVATLYQYFVSKEAILYTLAEQWIESVHALYSRHLAALRETTSMLDSLRAIRRDLDAMPDTQWNWTHLAPVMPIVPVLAELEAEHETRTARFWMTWLRHYGVDWDADRLEAFARMLYVQSDSAMTLAGRLPPRAGALDHALEPASGDLTA